MKQGLGRTALVWLAAGLLAASCGSPARQPAEAPPTPTVVEPAAPVPADTKEPAPVPSPVKGGLAPAVEAKDVATGETLRLSDLKGQVVLLNFWATWCPPCRVEMPHMEQLQKELRGRLRILAMGGDPREGPEVMAAFARDRGLTFTIGYDGALAARTYRAFGLPTSFFIDRQGIIRERVVGAMSYEQMLRLVLQAERPMEGQ